MTDNGINLMLGDCLERMKEIPDGSVDAVVCDPPYGLKFMGKDWDHGVPGKHYWEEVLRVAKPGAHLLAFGGTRTYHRLACAIEDAGWEIRDSIAWVYGSGFPKSMDISKALGKTDASYAKQWAGWGTALKPALEPIVLARKPLEGTVANNITKHGVGGLNIDSCRVAVTGESKARDNEASQNMRYTGNGSTNFAALPGVRGGDAKGRFPANLIHDGSDEVLSLFPNTKSGLMKAGTKRAA